MNHTVILIIAVAAIIAIVAVYASNRLIKARMQEARHHTMDQNIIMTQALSMGDYYIIEHDLKTLWVRNISGHLLPDEGMSLQEFDARFDEESRRKTQEAIANQVNDGEPKDYYGRRWNRGTAEQPDYHYFQGSAIIENDADGQPRYIITTLFYITREIEEERANTELTNKYRRMFDTTLLAMSFYNADGWLIDLNEQMRRLCEFDAEGERFFRKTNMFDIPLFSQEYDRDSRESLHVCQHMLYPELGIDKYIEFRVRSIYDADQLMYYTVTARDITDERKMYLDMHRQDDELRHVNETASRYERELRFLLENNKMYVWQLDVATRTITFSRSLRVSEYSIPFADYADSMFPDDRARALAALADIEATRQPFQTVHHFRHTPADTRPRWYAISGMPLCTDDGQLERYFGLARDVTQLMDAQQRLKEETARAEDSGQKKSAFLANMTHEIRTPLNSIVGFSDLLQTVDDEDEKQEFVRIIRNNCDMLLRLINDILEASTMSSTPVIITPTDVDFAQTFNDICQTLEQRVQEPGVQFVKDNPYATFPTRLDKGRVQQIITNFVTNAIKYTHEGHIKVGYRLAPRPGSKTTAATPPQEQAGLYIYCEDTGAGIPKEKQDAVFERFVKLNDFVQGTGLGLSICKSIAERCGGCIGVESEGEGHGSTFWIWIPCETRHHADQ